MCSLPQVVDCLNPVSIASLSSSVVTPVQESVRSWPQVVDSTDRGRVAIARGELTSLLGHEHLEAVPVLVIANKQDLRDAMTPGELSAALRLPDVKVTSPHIMATSRTSAFR